MDDQIRIENEYRRRLALTNKGGLSLQQAFGTMEEWVLHLGAHRLVLDPVVQQWLYFDRLHQDWETTSFGPGEVAFLTVGTRLGWKRGAPVASATAAASATERRTCPACQSLNLTRARFCNQCGAALGCPACGAVNTANSRFCNQCGATLSA